LNEAVWLNEIEHTVYAPKQSPGKGTCEKATWLNMTLISTKSVALI
jgi:hypothetical protein